MFIFIGILLYMIAVLIHVFICYQDVSKSLRTKEFILYGLFAFFTYVIILSNFRVENAIPIAIIFLLLIPVYLIIYVSTELVSPSRKILQVVSQHPGATYEEIFVALEREHFIMSRLSDLLKSDCIEIKDSAYYLTGQGKLLTKFLETYQGALGRPMGG